jgi:hypothetical protein
VSNHSAGNQNLFASSLSEANYKSCSCI